MTQAACNAADPPLASRDGEQASTETVSCLEHDQPDAGTERPVGRAQLGRQATVALWVLRVFVIVVGAMVIYGFVAQLGHGS